MKTPKMVRQGDVLLIPTDVEGDERAPKAKANGFRWEAEAKLWTRTMVVEDAAALPFKVRQVQP